MYFGLSALRQHFDPTASHLDKNSEDVLWINTSKSWLDREACRWISLCGLTHWHPDPAVKPWGNYWREKRQRKFMTSIDKEIGSCNRGTKRGGGKKETEDLPVDGASRRSGKWEGDPRLLKKVPKYVIDHAPLVHLYSKEYFWPSDFAEHLVHTTPYLNHTPFNLSNNPYTLYNLHELNEEYDGEHIFMHSNDDVEQRPNWLGSAYNLPTSHDDDHNEQEIDQSHDEMREKYFDPPQKQSQAQLRDWPYRARKIDLRRSQMHNNQHLLKNSSIIQFSSSSHQNSSGYSRAPSILVIVDKGSNIVDAFWFYFYSYNLGTTVSNIRFGNHVGDWEHSLIRFQNGVPESVFLSAHSGGLAYDWEAVEKGKEKGQEGRPILYSAVGSHAMYATPGKHPYILPFSLLADVTDKGPLWDPALNYVAYHYNTSITHNADARSIANASFSSSNYSTFDTNSSLAEEKYDSFRPAACNPSAPLGWWWYDGHWGDKFYELHDWRQWRFFGQYHYVNGPFGPRFKNLGRAKVCQSGPSCRIVKKLSEKRSWIRIYQ